ncbi:MAG: hypothetical protein JST80_00445 [Bdellovibrionales bacterium]|nr:hypothetical protein [Bdellovibrionales bacterium]
MKREKPHRTSIAYGIFAATILTAYGLSSSASTSIFEGDHGGKAYFDAFPDRNHDDHDSIMSGVAIVPPSIIERFIRQIIAKKLNADVSGSRIRFKTKPIHELIKIPSDDVVLQDVLKALGIQNAVNANISPIDVDFSLPANGLDLKLRHTKPGIFDVIAKWKVTGISAASTKLNIRVPKGLFDQDFDLDSKPVQIGLKKGSVPINIELKLQVNLATTGTKLKLVSLKTNLNDPNPANHPAFSFKIGQLTVDDQPLHLEIQANQTLQADEAVIREQLMRLEPELTETLRNRLNDELQEQISKVAETFEKAPSFNIKVDTDSITDKPGTNEAVVDLLHGIDAQFNFSSLGYLESSDLFFAKVASHVCFDGRCLFDSQVSPISEDDMKSLSKTSEIGMLIYESWLQRVINSDPFQKRITTYYNTKQKAPGVDIGKGGVKLHLNPATKSIDAVFNLAIDIKKTALSKKADTKWKKFWDRKKKQFADWVEVNWGTGKLVVIPVEVHLTFKAYEKGIDKKTNKPITEMVFTTTLPFHEDGTVTNTYNSPSNIQNLTKIVKNGFMESIEDTFKDLVPAEVRIPVPDSVPVQGIQMPLRRVQISPNHGLIFTAEVPEVQSK